MMIIISRRSRVKRNVCTHEAYSKSKGRFFGHAKKIIIVRNSFYSAFSFLRIRFTFPKVQKRLSTGHALLFTPVTFRFSRDLWTTKLLYGYPPYSVDLPSFTSDSNVGGVDDVLKTTRSSPLSTSSTLSGGELLHIEVKEADVVARKMFISEW